MNTYIHVWLKIFYNRIFRNPAADASKNLPMKDVFVNYFHQNYWGSNESVSGPGSELKITQVLIPQLNDLLDRFNIQSVLDIPCGDFNWMQQVKLQNRNYLGGDIVEELIQQNNQKFSSDHLTFKVMDITDDDLPASDLVVCRDCLVHFSYTEIYKALRQIKNSGSKYLLATSFNKFPGNYDIVTGKWRLLNLEKAPFNFGKPLLIIEELKIEGIPEYYNKVLGLWEIDKIKLK